MPGMTDREAALHGLRRERRVTLGVPLHEVQQVFAAQARLGEAKVLLQPLDGQALVGRPVEVGSSEDSTGGDGCGATWRSHLSVPGAEAEPRQPGVQKISHRSRVDKNERGQLRRRAISCR